MSQVCLLAITVVNTYSAGSPNYLKPQTILCSGDVSLHENKCNRGSGQQQKFACGGDVACCICQADHAYWQDAFIVPAAFLSSNCFSRGEVHAILDLHDCAASTLCTKS